MLIINADDLGKDKLTTENILACYEKGSITSASAMVFMADSERSADQALETKLEAGLHLNFSLQFSGLANWTKLNAYQQCIASFLGRNKYCFLLYNPLLKKHFDYVYKAQYEEYVRLYNRIPTHIDGHEHMHLCMNIMIDKIIPKGAKVRRNFFFTSAEKDPFNRLYRRIVDAWLTRRYDSTDFFFDISPIRSRRLERIINLAKISNVELMVHPERPAEYTHLMSDEYLEAISGIEKCTYETL
ncbi:MAG: ChbG/HpnK family deacetylase [Candidatus Hodarchaeota archaeon]